MVGAKDRRVLAVTRRAYRGARLIFDLDRELHSRLATLAGHVEKLGRSLESTVEHYNGVVGSMERQLLPTARKFNKLDESTVLGPLAAIEDSSRDLGAGVAGCCELRFV